MNDWTYGAEHELSDWHLDTKLPDGCAHDRKDNTMVNSNGIANDPKGISWKYGGEINTPPSSLDAQVGHLANLRHTLPDATVNYRSNLHIHIRVPGLIDDLAALKRVQACFYATASHFLPIVDPVPEIVPVMKPDGMLGLPERDEEAWEAAAKRRKRRFKSHHLVQSIGQHKAMMAADTVQSFFDAEVPQKNGRALHHLAARKAVNLRQMMDTETIEFRHFVGTLDTFEMNCALTWCRDWLARALAWDDDDPEWVIAELMQSRYPGDFPRTPLFDHRLERGYQLTNHGHGLKRADIERNIQKILGGEL